MVLLFVCLSVTFLVIVSSPKRLDIATLNFTGAFRGYWAMFCVTQGQGQKVKQCTPPKLLVIATENFVGI